MRRVDIFRGSGAIGVHVEAPSSQGGRFPWTGAELADLRRLGFTPYEDQLVRDWEMPNPADIGPGEHDKQRLLRIGATESADTVAAVFRDVFACPTPDGIATGIMNTEE
jgi:hypothetical protein